MSLLTEQEIKDALIPVFMKQDQPSIHWPDIFEEVAAIESAVLASQHLNRVKAEALREAADGILVGETWITREAADYWLRLRADAIEKGEL